MRFPRTLPLLLTHALLASCVDPSDDTMTQTPDSRMQPDEAALAWMERNASALGLETPGEDMRLIAVCPPEATAASAPPSCAPDAW